VTLYQVLGFISY